MYATIPGRFRATLCVSGRSCIPYGVNNFRRGFHGSQQRIALPAAKPTAEQPVAAPASSSDDGGTNNPPKPRLGTSNGDDGRDKNNVPGELLKYLMIASIVLGCLTALGYAYLLLVLDNLKQGLQSETKEMVTNVEKHVQVLDSKLTEMVTNVEKQVQVLDSKLTALVKDEITKATDQVKGEIEKGNQRLEASLKQECKLQAAELMLRLRDGTMANSKK